LNSAVIYQMVLTVGLNFQLWYQKDVKFSVNSSFCYFAIAYNSYIQGNL